MGGMPSVSATVLAQMIMPKGFDQVKHLQTTISLPGKGHVARGPCKARVRTSLHLDLRVLGQQTQQRGTTNSSLTFWTRNGKSSLDLVVTGSGASRTPLRPKVATCA